MEGGKDQAEGQGSPGCRGEALHAEEGEGEGGVCPHYPCRGAPRAVRHVSRVDRVLQELESRAVRGEFLLVFGGRERGWSKRNQLSLLALTSSGGKLSYVGWGRKGGVIYAILP